MDVFSTTKAMRAWSRACRVNGESVAFVPTMGSLHDGHISLVRSAKERADRVVVSIYVNPSQFAPGEDLESYPRDSEGDRAKLLAAGCDAVFEPVSLYESGHETWVRVERLEQPMCGKSRPIFFRGVATVVCKLFHAVEPDIAVFGKKDFQQWRVIERMVRDLDFGIEIVGLPIVREADGLAMSSRNARLGPAERVVALSLSRALHQAHQAVQRGIFEASVLIDGIQSTLSEAGARIDYVEIVDAVTLEPVGVVDRTCVVALAAHVGAVRLIDNLEISPEPQ